MIIVVGAVGIVVLDQFAVQFTIQFAVTTATFSSTVTVAIAAVAAITKVTVTVTAITTVTITVTRAIRVTSFGRNIRENQLHLLGVLYHFGHLIQGLLAERFIGQHTTDDV